MFAGSEDDIVFGDEGNDSLEGNTGNDYISGGEGADLIEGGSGNDKLIGDDRGQGKSEIIGDSDTLRGGSGEDRLWGGRGDDILDGGSGNDYLWGGAGENIFIFAFDEQAGAREVDVIVDFGKEDNIDLTAFNAVAVKHFTGDGEAELMVTKTKSGIVISADQNGDAVWDLSLIHI